MSNIKLCKACATVLTLLKQPLVHTVTVVAMYNRFAARYKRSFAFRMTLTSCRVVHMRCFAGPAPDPDTVEAAKPREHRDWRKLLGEDSKQQGGGGGYGQQQQHGGTKRQR